MNLIHPGPRRLRLALLSLITLVTAANAETTLGKIGDIELTATETREALAGLEATQESTLSKDPAALGNYVRALLVQRLVLKQAAEKKFDQDPAVIARLVRARETALADAYLASFSQPPAGYPSEAELAAAYETAKPSLLIAKTYRLAQIFTKDEAKIQDAAKQLKTKTADFAAIAKATSEEPATAGKGGEIGWLAETQLQPEIRSKLPKLTPGTVSEPIQLNDGWHIIKVLEVREGTTATLDQVRPQLIARLRADRATQLRQEFIAGLVKENPIAINEIELSKILAR